MAYVNRRKSRRSINQINMVPFIDVMLVLLIIFMVTAPLISPSLINLPQVGKASDQPQQVVQVQIDAAQKITVQAQGQNQAATLENIVTTVENFQNQLVAAAPTPTTTDTAPTPAAMIPVVIHAEKSIPYEAVIRVMDTLQRAGVQRVGLSVQLDASPSSGNGSVIPSTNTAP